MKRWATPLIIIVYLLIILLPPLINGYIYPTLGDDSAEHLHFIDNLKNGNQGALYFGQYITNYSLIWIENFTHISTDTLFLWFNFLSFAASGLVVAVMLKNFVGFSVALVISLLVLFSTGATMHLFLSGTIYNFINILIILPLAIYTFGVFRNTRKWQYLILGGVTLLLFTVYHPSSVGYLGNSLPISLPIPNNITATPFIPLTSQVNVVTRETGISIQWFALRFVGVGLWMTLIVSLVILWYKKALQFEPIFILPTILLGGNFIVGFAQWTNFSSRIELNAAVYTSLIIAILAAMAYRVVDKPVKPLLLGMVFIVTVSSIIGWFGYNSAVSRADVQMIKYLNDNDIKEVAMSSQVAPWIYFRYINAGYNPDAPLMVYRDKPMTLRTTDGLWLWAAEETRVNTQGYVFKATDGNVSVYLIKVAND